MNEKYVKCSIFTENLPDKDIIKTLQCYNAVA